MLKPTSSLALLLAAVSAAAPGCGGASKVAVDADASARVDADASGAVDRPDGPPPCIDASAPADSITYDATGDVTCGGQVAVAGVTPFGVFAPRNVRVSIGLVDCAGLEVFFVDGSPELAVGDPAGASLSFFVPAPEGVGTFHVSGMLESGAGAAVREVNVPVTMNITAADALPRQFDASFSTTGPPGQIVGTIDVDTGCGHVVGSFTAPYCGWHDCVL